MNSNLKSEVKHLFEDIEREMNDILTLPPNTENALIFNMLGVEKYRWRFVKAMVLEAEENEE